MARGFKTGGRQIGSSNKITSDLREKVSKIDGLELEDWHYKKIILLFLQYLYYIYKANLNYTKFYLIQKNKFIATSSNQN